MPYTRLWIHIVWTTKNRQPLLTKEHRKIILEHIKENAKKHSIHVYASNGWLEHVHLLVSLNASQKLSEVVQLIK